MIRIVLLLALFLTGCASPNLHDFDKTNISPGQRIPGLGFSFLVPNPNGQNWFASVYGGSHRIKLTQLNGSDSYYVEVLVNRGPNAGMYPTVENHLYVVQQHKKKERIPRGVVQHSHDENIDTRFGDLCVRFDSVGEDYRGRENLGPAKVEKMGLTCAHEGFENVLLSIELTRRSDADAAAVDLNRLAEKLFSSVNYTANR